MCQWATHHIHAQCSCLVVSQNLPLSQAHVSAIFSVIEERMRSREALLQNVAKKRGSTRLTPQGFMSKLNIGTWKPGQLPCPRGSASVQLGSARVRDQYRRVLNFGISQGRPLPGLLPSVLLVCDKVTSRCAQAEPEHECQYESCPPTRAGVRDIPS